MDESMIYPDAVVYGMEGAETLIDNVQTELAHGEDLGDGSLRTAIGRALIGSRAVILTRLRGT